MHDLAYTWVWNYTHISQVRIRPSQRCAQTSKVGRRHQQRTGLYNREGYSERHNTQTTTHTVVDLAYGFNSMQYIESL